MICLHVISAFGTSIKEKKNLQILKTYRFFKLLLTPKMNSIFLYVLKKDKERLRPFF